VGGGPATAARASSVGGLLLAAGAGRRFGGPKALATLGGQSLLARGVGLLAATRCDPIVVVIGAEAERVRQELGIPGGPAVEVVENASWAEGMSASLRAGLAALQGRCAAAVVALADQPLVSPVAVDRLIRAWEGGARVAVATYGGAPRNPVLLDAGLWCAVAAQAVGDEGARSFLRANPSLVTAVPCDDAGAPDDVDTPDDLAAIEKSLSRRRT
jgi:CTP:molybdopterin cytidylyltransferase MocA